MSRTHPLENRIPPPVVVLVTGLAMGLASLVTAKVDLPFAIPVGAGSTSALAGLGFFILGVATFRRAQTTVDPVRLERASRLVTTGVYRLTRNPMYLGFTLLLVSLSAALAAPWTLLGPMAFVVFTTRFQILPEERAMRAKFGNAYVDYQLSVRRWL